MNSFQSLARPTASILHISTCEMTTTNVEQNTTATHENTYFKTLDRLFY